MYLGGRKLEYLILSTPWLHFQDSWKIPNHDSSLSSQNKLANLKSVLVLSVFIQCSLYLKLLVCSSADRLVAMYIHAKGGDQWLVQGSIGFCMYSYSALYVGRVVFFMVGLWYVVLWIIFWSRNGIAGKRISEKNTIRLRKKGSLLFSDNHLVKPYPLHFVQNLNSYHSHDNSVRYKSELSLIMRIGTEPATSPNSKLRYHWLFSIRYQPQPSVRKKPVIEDFYRPSFNGGIGVS